MTVEHEKLLIRDLCARLPYGVVVRGNDDYCEGVGKLEEVNPKTASVFIDVDDDESSYFLIEYVKPYLRSMSSMTEEENMELYNSTGATLVTHKRIAIGEVAPYEVADVVDWLNARHFDYRGLIGKGLAIVVTEENNPYNDNYVF